MSRASAEAYRARLKKVVAFVDARLEGPISLDELAAVARFSKFHFHRQFAELYGITVTEYAHASRMKRAFYKLAFRGARVVDVALESGYEGPEAFARAFKKVVGQSPSAARSRPGWEAVATAFATLRETRRHHMSPTPSLDDVKTVAFPETAVAELVHRGSPARLGATIRRFIAWRKAHRLPPSTSATFNVAYDDPTRTKEDDFRFGLAVATREPVAANEEGLVANVIPGGRCAVLRHVGSDDSLATSIRFLYARWLPESGEELRDFPLFFQRVRFFPDVPESEAVTDIFLPLV